VLTSGPEVHAEQHGGGARACTPRRGGGGGCLANCRRATVQHQAEQSDVDALVHASCAFAAGLRHRWWSARGRGSLPRVADTEATHRLRRGATHSHWYEVAAPAARGRFAARRARRTPIQSIWLDVIGHPATHDSTGAAAGAAAVVRTVGCSAHTTTTTYTSREPTQSGVHFAAVAHALYCLHAERERERGRGRETQTDRRDSSERETRELPRRSTSSLVRSLELVCRVCAPVRRP
jgi:hypothetical protein